MTLSIYFKQMKMILALLPPSIRPK